ncbi:hypothetical protein EON66_02345 [archaeon]|nr:MAG: hypothetical protein EON66_02345 [archaeon]
MQRNTGSYATHSLASNTTFAPTHKASMSQQVVPQTLRDDDACMSPTRWLRDALPKHEEESASDTTYDVVNGAKSTNEQPPTHSSAIQEEAVLLESDCAVLQTSGVKRSRGRPRKSESSREPASARTPADEPELDAVGVGEVAGVKRSRGRPRKVPFDVTVFDHLEDMHMSTETAMGVHESEVDIASSDIYVKSAFVTEQCEVVVGGKVDGGQNVNSLQ